MTLSFITDLSIGLRSVQEGFKQTTEKKADRLEPLYGELTTVNGVVDVEGRDSYDWFKQQGSSHPVQILNRKVSSTNGLPVVVGNRPPNTTVEVLEVDISLIADQTLSLGPKSIVAHASEHLPGGADLVWVDPRQLAEFAVFPATGLAISVASGYYNFGNQTIRFPGVSSIDISGSQPAATDHIAVGIYLDIVTNAIATIDGAAVLIGARLALPTWPAGSFPLAIIDLDGTQTTISFTDDIISTKGTLSDTVWKRSTVSAGDIYYDDGDVGIGTTSPDMQLHIVQDGTGLGAAPAWSANIDAMVIEAKLAQNVALQILTPNDKIGNLAFSDTDVRNKGVVSYSHADDSMRLITNGAEVVRVDSAGDVGIGTTTPLQNLELARSAANVVSSIASYSITNTHSGVLLLQKSASATMGTLAETADGERLGDIRFAGVDTGGNSENSIFIRGVQVGVAGTRVSGELQFYTSTDNTSAATQKMVIANDGNVGIGTTSPDSKLHLVDGPSGDQLRFTRGTGIIRLLQSNNVDDLFLYNNDLSNLVMFWEGSTGSVGIKTSTPDTRLDIAAGALSMAEMTAPGSGAVNTVRIYAEDNGAGKTRLMAIFNTGAAQQVAIQP